MNSATLIALADRLDAIQAELVDLRGQHPPARISGVAEEISLACGNLALAVNALHPLIGRAVREERNR